MLNKFSSVLLLLFCFQSFAQNWSTVYEKVKPSVPIIFHNGTVCSGALIEPQLILTAAHCVAQLRPLKVSFFGEEKTYHNARLAAIRSEYDLALIQLDQPVEKPILRVRQKNDLLVGAPVATIGHPTYIKLFKNPSIDLDSTYLISSGVISKATKRDYITDTSVSPGNSGGPLLDQSGEIVGVVSRKRADRLAGQISYAAKQNKVRELLDEFKGKRTRQPYVLFAQSKLNLGVELGHHSLLSEIYDDSGSIWSTNIGVDLLDRIRLSYASSFSRSEVRFSKYAFGYVFKIPLPNRVLLVMTPSSESFEYKFKKDASLQAQYGERVRGESLSIGLSSSPLFLKYSRFDLNGQDENIFTLQLSFL